MRQVESLTELQQSSQARLNVFHTWSDSYTLLAGLILRPGYGEVTDDDVALAFDLLERMRARELMEDLALNDAAPMPLEADDPLRGEQERLDQAIVEHNQELLDPGLEADRRAELEASLAKLELDRDAVSEEIVRAHPERAIAQPKRATLDQVAAGLAPNEALLSYQLAFDEDIYGDFAGSSWVTVVTGAGARVVHLGDGRPLMRASEDFLEQFGNRRQRRRGIAGAELLHDDLLRPALETLPTAVDSLVIVPDGVLHLMPFAMLRDGGGRPLADRFTLQVAPSASLWMRWRAATRPATAGTALVLADPVTRNTATSPAGGLTLRGVHDEAGNLPPLPAARLEGEVVVDHLRGSAQLLVGEAASERALKDSDLSRFRVLHVAAHAIVDEENPDRSAVFLAAGSENEDGLLQMREIVELDLEGRVVGLSACSSAHGTLLRGEGVMSLARAFFAAGAPAVVGSLWPLADEPAKELFDSFYRHLSEGRTVAEALRGAQRERVAGGASVEDWASVEVFGNGSFVPFPHRGQGRWLVAAMIVAAALLVSTVGWILRRRSTAAGSGSGP